MKRWVQYSGLILAMIMSGSIGCDERARQSGEEGNIAFFYYPADESTRFDRPLAVGSELLLFAEPIGGREMESLTGVEVGRETVVTAEIATEERNPPAVRLTGRANGETTLRVQARGGGEVYVDSTSLQVSEVDKVGLGHQCTSARDAAYMMENEIVLDLVRHNRSGDILVGSAQSRDDARRSCQVEMTPAFFQDQPHCDELGLHFPGHIFTELESFTVAVAPEVDTLRNTQRVANLHIIHPNELFFDGVEAELQVDTTRPLRLHPVSYEEDWPVCMNFLMEVEILTSNICSGPSGQRRFTVEPEEENQFELRGIREGYCEMAVTLPQVDGEPWIFEAYVERRR